MNRLTYVLALLAALAGVTPGVCMCGCPCNMLLAGDEVPAGEAPQAPPSCCHAAAPSDGTTIVGDHDCCCDAQAPQAAESCSLHPPSPGDASHGVAGTLDHAVTASLLVDALPGPDPPGEAGDPQPPSRRAVLRN